MIFSLHFHSRKAVADPQSLLEDKEAAEEKFAISDYELRLAQEDILKLKSELQKKAENPNELNGIFLVFQEILPLSFIFYEMKYLFGFQCHTVFNNHVTILD